MNRETTRQFYRSRDHRILAGVAGGVAEYSGVNPTIVRVLWIIAGLLMPPMTVPLALLVYGVLALVIPLEPGEE